MPRWRAVIISVCWWLVTGGSGAVLVPWWLTRWRPDHSVAWWPAATVVGGSLVLLGTLTTALVFVEFVRADGTPMPGTMPRRLVITGLNRHVRNPIYLGALAIFAGETLLLLRWSMLAYSLIAFASTATYVHWIEEPALTRRFGPDYDTYRRAVPAWRPRLGKPGPDTNHPGTA